MFPGTDLLLDCLPLLELDLTEHVVLDHDDFVELVNLGVDDFVLDGVNRPQFNLINIDLRSETSKVSNVKLAERGAQVCVKVLCYLH